MAGGITQVGEVKRCKAGGEEGTGEDEAVVGIVVVVVVVIGHTKDQITLAPSWMRFNLHGTALHRELPKSCSDNDE